VNRHRHRGVLRAAIGSIVVTAALLLSGCTAPLPDVTFYGGRTTVTADPSLWCAADAAGSKVDCRIDKGDGDAPRLRVTKGSAISVNLPATIGAAPWVVLFQYRDAAGTTQDARSPLFAAGARQDYILRPPSATDQLVRVEVQSGLTPIATASGSGVDYAAMRTWVLVIDPA